MRKFILLLLFVLTSCDDKISVHTFNPANVVFLNATKVVDLSKHNISHPLYVKMFADKIVIVDDTSQDILKVIDTDGNLLGAYGNTGRGPGEFNQISSVDFYVDQQVLKIGVLDQGYKKFFEIENLSNANVKWTTDIELDVSHRIADSMYICSAVNDTASIYLLDSQGNIVDRSFNLPPNTDNRPLLSHSMACSADITTSINSPFFARSTVYDGGIDFFRVENNKIAHKWRFSNFDMTYDIDENYHNVPAPNNETRRGYISKTLSADKIMGLFSGRKILDDHSNQANEIHIFDYQGNHLTKFILDRAVTEILFDDKTQTIYAIEEDREGKIGLLKFKVQN